MDRFEQFLMSLFGMSFGEGMSYPSKDDPNFNYNCESLEAEGYNIKRETWISKDGSIRMTKVSTEPNMGEKPLTIEALKKKRDAAVEVQDFHLAHKYQLQIEELEKTSKK